MSSPRSCPPSLTSRLLCSPCPYTRPFARLLAHRLVYPPADFLASTTRASTALRAERARQGRCLELSLWTYLALRIALRCPLFFLDRALHSRMYSPNHTCSILRPAYSTPIPRSHVPRSSYTSPLHSPPTSARVHTLSTPIFYSSPRPFASCYRALTPTPKRIKGRMICGLGPAIT
jgi:hypothetical protein